MSVADAHQQLARTERLHQIVVGAAIQPFDARFFAGARREQNDGSGAQLRIRAQLADEPEPVQARHHHVGDDQIGAQLTRRLERGLTVRDGVHVVVLGKQPSRVLAQIGVVVREQNSRQRSAAAAPAAAYRRAASSSASAT